MSNLGRTGNKICGRLCLELTGHLASPMSIGSGQKEVTDGDVILDARGIPFIPGSTIAGVLRAYSKEIGKENESDLLFGSPYDGIPGTDTDRQSRVFCYDTFLENAMLRIRDGVKLGKNKTSVPGSKYELQIIERNASFRMRIEIIEREDCLNGKNDIQTIREADKSWVERWIYAFSKGELRIGAKSYKGFGKLEIDSARLQTFHMEDKDEYLKWLDWHWDNEDAFEQAETIDIGRVMNAKGYLQTEHCLQVPFKIPYTLLVRTYHATVGRRQDLPDYEQLTVGGKGEQAVLPGSSIAGAFRSHIGKIVKKLAHLQTWEEAQKMLEPFFGTWIEEGNREEDFLSSKIIFEETVINGGHGLPLSRIAVDRFTGGTVKGALFEEQPWVDGTALLCIRWKKDNEEQRDKISNSKVICGLLLWAVLDLLSGFLPIGGETAIGRGIFCKCENKGSEILLDGKVLDEQKKQEYMQIAALWCKGEEDGTAGNEYDGRF